MQQEYVYYKGDEVKGIGTIKELSKRFNLKESTLRGYASPSYYKRMQQQANKNFPLLVKGE